MLGGLWYPYVGEIEEQCVFVEVKDRTLDLKVKEWENSA